MQSQLPLRVAFAGLWCAADREGRFRWRPNQLKLDILPYDQVDMARVLDALSTRGFIVGNVSSTRGPHVVDAPPDGDCGFIPSWRKHQIINNRESASKLPVPDQVVENLDQVDASITRQPHVVDATSTRLVHAQGEGEREEEEKKKEAASAGQNEPKGEQENGFELFYASFPNHVAKPLAQKAYKKALGKTTTQVIIAGAKRYAVKQATTDPRYIKHPAAWLNEERWNDGLVAEPTDLVIPPSWREHAEKLISEIGSDNFRSYIANTLLDRGPPPTIHVSLKVLVDHIPAKFSRSLIKVLGSEFRVKYTPAQVAA